MYLVEEQLRDILHSLGAYKYETHFPEVTLLANLLQEGETIKGIVFGRYKHFLEGLNGRGALIATNYRIVLIDRKPAYMRYEELPYSIIAGVEDGSSGAIAQVTLKTRIGDIVMKSWNRKSIDKFVHSVETRTSSDASSRSYNF